MLNESKSCEATKDLFHQTHDVVRRKQADPVESIEIPYRAVTMLLEDTGHIEWNSNEKKWKITRNWQWGDSSIPEYEYLIIPARLVADG